MRTPPTVVFALIDWHNIKRYFAPDFDVNPRRKLPGALLRLQAAIASTLQHTSTSTGYRVFIRMYHGWHAGREQTQYRTVFNGHNEDASMARKIGSVSFAAGFHFGNELACGTARNPLYNTFRSGGQKMVDTAICADLLHLLHTKEADLVLVVSDDDDFVPAVFTASSWSRRSILLRPAGRTLADVTDGDCADIVRYWSE